MKGRKEPASLHVASLLVAVCPSRVSSQLHYHDSGGWVGHCYSDIRVHITAATWLLMNIGMRWPQTETVSVPLCLCPFVCAPVSQCVFQCMCVCVRVNMRVCVCVCLVAGGGGGRDGVGRVTHVHRAKCGCTLQSREHCCWVNQPFLV